MKKFSTALFLTFATLCAVGTATTSAEARGWVDKDQDRAREEVETGRYVSLQSIIATCRARYGGRLIDADLDQRSHRYNLLWEARDGRVLRIKADARTGRILRVS